MEIPPKSITTLLLLCTLKASAVTSAPDTTDTWQIYNGKELILDGHLSPLGTNFHHTLKKEEVRDLEISVSRHGPSYSAKRIVRITNETGRTVVRKEFKNDHSKMIVTRAEFGKLTSKFLIVGYIENENAGPWLILGHLIIQDSPEPEFKLEQQNITKDYRSKIDALRKKREHFYEDDQYVVDKTCSGEWGGTILFRNKRTEAVRMANATCPVAVVKVYGKYVVTASLAHLSGFSEVLEIANPDNLSVPTVSKQGLQIDGKSKKGTIQLLDSIGVLALGSFLQDGALRFVVTDFGTTYLAKIEHKRFVVIDIIAENLHTSTSEAEVIVTDDHHIVITVDGGYIDVFGKTVTLMR